MPNLSRLKFSLSFPFVQTDIECKVIVLVRMEFLCESGKGLLDEARPRRVYLSESKVK